MVLLPLQHLAFNASIYTLVVVALDRYRGIMFPLKGCYSKFWAKMAAGLIWAASFALALPNLIVYHVSTSRLPFPFARKSGLLSALECEVSRRRGVKFGDPICTNGSHSQMR